MRYASPARGFAALLSVLSISLGLVSLAASAGESAYRIRAEVIRAEHKARAAAAARSCADAAFMRIQRKPSALLMPETLWLKGGMSCALVRHERAGEMHRIESTARSGGVEVRIQTDAQISAGSIIYGLSRRI